MDDRLSFAPTATATAASRSAQAIAWRGQLLIKVGGCGLCHTDVAIMGKTKAQLDEWHATPPFTLGHEIAGWVAEIGQGRCWIQELANQSQWCPCGEVADTVRHAAAEKKTSAITFRPSMEPASDSMAVLRNTFVVECALRRSHGRL